MSSGLYSGVSGLALGVGLYRGVSGLWSGASGLITGWGGAVSPALNLNLLAGPLDSRITFSRGSNATMIDGTGRIVYAPANLLLWSQDFDNAYWSKFGTGVAVPPVVTANAGIAPDGTSTAERVQFNCVNNTNSANRSWVNPTSLSASAGVRYVGSVWVKAFDLANVGQTLRLAIDNLTDTIHTLTADWQRIFVTGLAVGPIGNFLIETRGTYTTQTADVLLWGAQLEPVTYQTTPSTYNPTTATAYYGPRFDAFPVTCLPRGLLLEGARTNIFTYSEDFTNAVWIPVAATVTANATTSPDGTTNADKLAEDATTNVHSIYQTYSQTLGVTYTFSFYAKAAERTWVRTRGGVGVNYFNLANGTVGNVAAGAAASITPVGNGWYRCAVTLTALTTGLGNNQIAPTTGNGVDNFAGTAGFGVFIYGAQQEIGNFVSSYIPTVASTATRNADSAIMTGNNFSSWYTLQSGTLVVGAEPEFSSTTGKPSALLLQSGTPNYHALYVDGPSGTLGYDVASSGVVMDFLASSYSYTPVPALQASLYSSVTSQYAVYGQAVTYSNNFFANSANGGPATTDTSGAVPEGLTSMVLGQNDGEYGYGGWFGWLRGVQAYGSASSTATLNQLSDAAGAAQQTLSLDFTGEMYYSGTVPFQTPPSFYVGFTVDAYVTED
jgi:hypothetical protein